MNAGVLGIEAPAAVTLVTSTLALKTRLRAFLVYGTYDSLARRPPSSSAIQGHQAQFPPQRHLSIAFVCLLSLCYAIVYQDVRRANDRKHDNLRRAPMGIRPHGGQRTLAAYLATYKHDWQASDERDVNVVMI